MGAVGGLMEVILYVQDMDAQVRFYRDTMGLPVKYPSDKEDYSREFWVELETGVCTLCLHGGGERRFGEDAPKIVFRVAEIEAARAELLRTDVRIGTVRTAAPGILVCDGTDPEGNRFSLEMRTSDSH